MKTVDEIIGSVGGKVRQYQQKQQRDGEPDHPELEHKPNGATNGPMRAATKEGPATRPTKPTTTILCQPGQLDRMYLEAEDALLNAGAPLYQRAILVRPTEVEYDAAYGRKTHSTALVPVTGAALTRMLAQAANFTKFDARKNREVPCDPPTKLVDILLGGRGEWRFPVVRGVLTCPTLRPDGSLLKDRGYDPISRYYLMFPSNLKMPDIPPEPTMEDAFDSFARLDDLLDGYDFVEDGGVSRSVALAMLMTQVLRCAMGVSPLLAVSATAPGSGKSHLVDLASTIAIGRPCPIMGAGKDDKETEKGINTNLLSGVAGFSIDNVHRIVDLATLNIATERPMIGIRLFGSLESVEVENAVTIYMTGNNLDVVDEQVRRTLLCRLDAKEEQPETRSFEQDPIATVLANRGRVIADILIIALAYQAHGSQRDDIKPFGSYPEWSRFVREPLIWLDQPDPVTSQKFTRDNDPAATSRRNIISAWHCAFGTEAHTLAEAVRHATQRPEAPDTAEMNHADEEICLAAWKLDLEHRQKLLDALHEAFPSGRDGINTHALGQWLRHAAGRLTNDMKFVKAEGIDHGAVRWRLAK